MFSRRNLQEESEEAIEFAIHGGIDPSYIGVLAIVSLLGGIIFHTLLRKIPVPFTVLALALGLFLGELMQWTDGDLGALGNSISNWQRLHPNTVLVMFLPPLIFESAANIDFHVFSKAFGQILLLAGPGVMINIILVCGVVYYIFPYGWSFTQSIAFGAMFSATDPVAVVSLLRELGAPVSLSTIIEGESLLNDGVAFVIFLFTVDVMVPGDTHGGGGFGDFIVEFLYASGIGTLVGLVLGNLTTFVSSALFDDYIAQIMLTVVGAFGTFFIAEGLLQASGVLAVVAFGLCYAVFRHAGMDTSANEALEHVWEAMAFGANAVIFVYSGVLIIFYTHGESEIEAREWGYLFVLYIFLNLIRAFSIMVLYPALRCMGYGMSIKWAIVMSWGGLRGAVGLALGLILLTDTEIERKFATKTMFFMSGIVGLTLLVNAITTGPLVRYLGLNRTSAAAKTFYDRAVQLIAEHVHESILSMQRSTRYRGADWKRVWSHIPILSGEMRQTVERQIGSKVAEDITNFSTRMNDDSLVEVDSLYELVDDSEVSSEIMQDARLRFLNLVKSSYYRDFRNGAVTSKLYIGLLISATSTAQEEACSELCDWDQLERYCVIPGWYQKITWRYLRHILVIYRLSVSYQIASAFVTAHESVVPLFRQLVPDKRIADTIISESEKQIESAAKILCDFESNFPDITRTIKTRQVTEQLLKQLMSYAEDLLENGEIEEKELGSIVQGIHRIKAYMWTENYKLSEPRDRQNVFRECELFLEVPCPDVEEILKKSTEEIFNANQCLQKGGEKVRGLYIIVHGTVKVQCGTRNFRLSYGDTVNALSCVVDQVQEFTYLAASDVSAYFLPLADIKHLLEEHEDMAFERNLYFRAGIEAALAHPGTATGKLTANPWNIGHVMNKGEVIHAPNKTPSEKVGGVGILFSGIILKIGSNDCTPPLDPIVVFPLDEPVVCDNNAVYLWIPPEVSWILEMYHPLNAQTSRAASTSLLRRHSVLAMEQPSRQAPHGRSPRHHRISSSHRKASSRF